MGLQSASYPPQSGLLHCIGGILELAKHIHVFGGQVENMCFCPAALPENILELSGVRCRTSSAPQSSQQQQQQSGAGRGVGRSSSPAPTVLPMGGPLPGPPPPGRGMGLAGSPAAPAFGRSAPRGGMAGGPGRGLGRGMPPMGLSPLGTATGAASGHAHQKNCMIRLHFWRMALLVSKLLFCR